MRPDLKRGAFSQQEENLIIELHAVLGNRYFEVLNSFIVFPVCLYVFSFLIINSVAFGFGLLRQMVSDCGTASGED